MSTTIKTGWLNDKNGDKFAPKTLTSQIQTSDGTLLEDKITADIEAAKEDILKNVSIDIDDALSSLSNYYTETEVDTKLGSKSDATHNHDSVYDAKGSADTALNSAKTYTDEVAEGKANKSEGAFFVEGNGTTDATNKVSTWTGTSDRITEYYDGLAIKYKIGIVGQSTVTLNINNLGAKTVYRFSTTKLTTQFPVGSIIHLIYHSDLNDGCWVTNDYDANTNTYQRVYESSGNVEYPITTRYNTTDGASYYAEYGRYTNGVTLNPSTNTITATTFKGALSGNADTATSATKATQDASGNVITATYETKVNATAKLTDVQTQLDEIKEDINESNAALAQKTQIQFITWEADD